MTTCAIIHSEEVFAVCITESVRPRMHPSLYSYLHELRSHKEICSSRRDEEVSLQQINDPTAQFLSKDNKENPVK